MYGYDGSTQRVRNVIYSAATTYAHRCIMILEIHFQLNIVDYLLCQQVNII